jgi:hypothetical protein
MILYMRGRHFIFNGVQGGTWAAAARLRPCGIDRAAGRGRPWTGGDDTHSRRRAGKWAGGRGTSRAGASRRRRGEWGVGTDRPSGGTGGAEAGGEGVMTAGEGMTGIGRPSPKGRAWTS